jgi:hypothetical protein
MTAIGEHQRLLYDELRAVLRAGFPNFKASKTPVLRGFAGVSPDTGYREARRKVQGFLQGAIEDFEEVEQEFAERLLGMTWDTEAEPLGRRQEIAGEGLPKPVSKSTVRALGGKQNEMLTAIIEGIVGPSAKKREAGSDLTHIHTGRGYLHLAYDAQYWYKPSAEEGEVLVLHNTTISSVWQEAFICRTDDGQPFYLYQRDVALKGGRAVRIYFFATRVMSGALAAVPPGYVLVHFGSHKLPILKKGWPRE